MPKNKIHSTIKDYVRALRLPFITVSIFPYVVGSKNIPGNFNWFSFLLGLVAVIFTHLCANLINDYADSKSGVDWQDKTFYSFFGGSKLIQEEVFSTETYKNLAIACFIIATLCIFWLARLLSTISIVGYYAVILFLGLSYSHKPFQFSYYRLGEFIIFLLFGPAVLMGAYFIQTQIFPTLHGFMISLPFGFFTTAILFANEIPDFPQDKKLNKLTWVSITGHKNAYKLYVFLIALGFISIALNITLGNFGLIALFAFLAVIPALKAAKILKVNYTDKVTLIISSKLTILVHTLVSIVLIIEALL